MAFEEEMRKQKLMKEKEIAKMQANQKAFQDLQAAKDELSALRTQDKVILLSFYRLRANILARNLKSG